MEPVVVVVVEGVVQQLLGQVVHKHVSADTSGHLSSAPILRDENCTPAACVGLSSFQSGVWLRRESRSRATWGSWSGEETGLMEYPCA